MGDMWRDSDCFPLVPSATERILARARQLVDVKKDDGFSALHLAALNNHWEVAQTLLKEVSPLAPGGPPRGASTGWF